MLCHINGGSLVVSRLHMYRNIIIVLIFLKRYMEGKREHICMYMLVRLIYLFLVYVFIIINDNENE